MIPSKIIRNIIVSQQVKLVTWMIMSKVTPNMMVSHLVKLPNVIDLDTVKRYKKYDGIPAGKITKCD